MTLRRATFVALLGMLTVLGLSGTASAQYPPTAAGGTVSAGTVSSGGSVEFCGDGFAAGSSVEVADNGEVVKTVTVGADGGFCLTVMVSGAGAHALTGTGTGTDGETRVVTANVSVVAAGGLPRTGSDSILPAMGIGLALVGLGTAMVYGVRRKRAMASA